MKKLLVLAAILMSFFFAMDDLYGQIAVFTNIKARENVFKNGEKGIEIKFNLAISAYKGDRVNIIAYFYDVDENNVRSRNLGNKSGFCTKSGYTAVYEQVLMTNHSCSWDSMSLFLPYSALKHKSGKCLFSYRLCAELKKKENMNIGKSSYRNFSVTWSSSSSRTSESSKSSKTYPYTETTTSATGETKRTYYSNGRVEVVSTYECVSCSGSGNCIHCRGTGYIAFMNMYNPCPICAGRGECGYCHGSGKKVHSYSYNINTPSYNNSTPSYHGGGYNSSTSSSNSSTTRRQCGACRGSGQGMDKIIWSPNYTGNSNTRWCSECNAYKDAHTHVHERCGVCGGKGYLD